jgi:hypothetical protein
MTVRQLASAKKSEPYLFTATYRCPKCTTESDREFVCQL